MIRKELRALRPVSAGTLRVPVVRYLGYVPRGTSGIQHSVYWVLADHILPVAADALHYARDNLDENGVVISIPYRLANRRTQRYVIIARSPFS